MSKDTRSLRKNAFFPNGRPRSNLYVKAAAKFAASSLVALYVPPNRISIDVFAIDRLENSCK